MQSSDKFQVDEFHCLSDILAGRIAAIHPVTTVCNHEIRRFQTKCRFCFKEWSVSSTHTFYYVNNYKSENLPRCYNNGKLESGSFILLTPLK